MEEVVYYWHCILRNRPSWMFLLLLHQRHEHGGAPCCTFEILAIVALQLQPLLLKSGHPRIKICGRQCWHMHVGLLVSWHIYITTNCYLVYIFFTGASSGRQWRLHYQIIKGICDGVGYLHQQRIIHMDLKPDNILLDDSMVPRIADFGISRRFSENQSKIITENKVGSL